MRIKLSGGRLNGTEMEVSDRMSVVSFPLLSLRDNQAATASDGEVKRYSWDEDALNISYLDYYKTEMRVEGGIVIFVPKEVVHHYV